MLTIGTLLFYVFLIMFTLAAAWLAPVSFAVLVAGQKGGAQQKQGRKSWKSVFAFLGLTYKKGQCRQIIFDSFLLFFAILFVLAVESVLLAVFNIDDSAKVAFSISQFSLLTIVVSATIGPFAEELFFRGFLQKYAGVFVSAGIFAALHYAFGSVSEIIGAFTAAMILGWWVKYCNSNLLPVIIAHALYNLTSILLVVV